MLVPEPVYGVPPVVCAEKSIPFPAETAKLPVRVAPVLLVANFFELLN